MTVPATLILEHFKKKIIEEFETEGEGKNQY